MNSSDYDYLFKCLLIGDSNVGKSSMILRFADGGFKNNYTPTIGIDFRIKTIEMNGKFIKLQLWDTSGQERFSTITRSYYRGTHLIVVCFDIAERHTFNNLGKWLNEIDRFAGTTMNYMVIVCGMKQDLESRRTVSYEEAKSYCDDKHVEYFESSSKNNINIDKIFMDVTAKLITSTCLTMVEKENKSNIILTGNIDITKTKKCCF